MIRVRIYIYTEVNSLAIYQRRERGQRQNYGRDRSRSNNRQGQNFVKMGTEIITEGTGTHKILVEIMAEVEAEILTEIIAMIEVDQEKEGYHPEGIIITTKTDKT